MRVAIVSFFHTESSLCLAKYLAGQGCQVDFYFVANLLHDRRGTSGFEYPRARRTLGNHLLTRDEVPEMYGYLEQLPVRLYLSRIVHHDRYPWLNKCLMYLNMLQVRRRGYDAVNIVGQISWIETAHRVLRRENLVHTFHELGNHDGALSPLAIVRAAVRDGSKVIVHSEATLTRYLTLPGACPATTRMIPFGKFETLSLYVSETTQTLPFTDGRPVLLFYGYLLPYKGLDVLADALRRLESHWERFHIVVAGNGADDTLPFFRSLPNAHVINRFLSNDEMMGLIRQSSVILLPYKSASQTGIIPTCTLYGKPFIATRVGAFPESVVDGYNGLLVEPGDSQALAEAILRVVGDAALLAHLSEGAARYGVGDAYDWTRIARQTLDFYRQ